MNRVLTLCIVWLSIVDAIVDPIALQAYTEFQIQPGGSAIPINRITFTAACLGGETQEFSTEVNQILTANGTVVSNGAAVTDIQLDCLPSIRNYTTVLETWTAVVQGRVVVERSQTSSVQYVDKSILKQRQAEFDLGGQGVEVISRRRSTTNQMDRVKKNPRQYKISRGRNLPGDDPQVKNAMGVKDAFESKEAKRQRRSVVVQPHVREALHARKRATVNGVEVSDAECPIGSLPPSQIANRPSCGAGQTWQTGVTAAIATGAACAATAGVATAGVGLPVCALYAGAAFGIGAILDQDRISDQSIKRIQDQGDPQCRAQVIARLTDDDPNFDPDSLVGGQQIADRCSPYAQCAWDISPQLGRAISKKCIYEVVNANIGLIDQLNDFKDLVVDAIQAQQDLTLAVLDRLILLEGQIDAIQNRVLLLEQNQDQILDNIQSLLKIVQVATIGIQNNALQNQLNEFNILQTQQTTERNLNNVANAITQTTENLNQVQTGLLGTISDVSDQISAQTSIELKTVYANVYDIIRRLQNDIATLTFDTNLRLASLTQQIENILQRQNNENTRQYAQMRRITDSIDQFYEAFRSLISFTVGVGLTTADVHRAYGFIETRLGAVPFVKTKGNKPLDLTKWEMLAYRTWRIEEYLFFNIANNTTPANDGCDNLLPGDAYKLALKDVIRQEAVADFSVPIVADKTFISFGDKLTLTMGDGRRITPDCSFSITTACRPCTITASDQVCARPTQSTVERWTVYRANQYQPGNATFTAEDPVRSGDVVVLTNEGSNERVLHIEDPETNGQMCSSFAADSTLASDPSQYWWYVINPDQTDSRFPWLSSGDNFRFIPYQRLNLGDASTPYTSALVPLTNGKCVFYDAAVGNTTTTEDTVAYNQFDTIPNTVLRRRFRDGIDPFAESDSKHSKKEPPMEFIEDDNLDGYIDVTDQIIEQNPKWNPVKRVYAKGIGKGFDELQDAMKARKRNANRKRNTPTPTAREQDECRFTIDEYHQLGIDPLLSLAGTDTPWTNLYANQPDTFDPEFKNAFDLLCRSKFDQDGSCMPVVADTPDEVMYRYDSRITGIEDYSPWKRFGLGIHDMLQEVPVLDESFSAQFDGDPPYLVVAFAGNRDLVDYWDPYVNCFGSVHTVPSSGPTPATSDKQYCLPRYSTLDLIVPVGLRVKIDLNIPVFPRRAEYVLSDSSGDAVAVVATPGTQFHIFAQGDFPAVSTIDPAFELDGLYYEAMAFKIRDRYPFIDMSGTVFASGGSNAAGYSQVCGTPAGSYHQTRYELTVTRSPLLNVRYTLKCLPSILQISPTETFNVVQDACGLFGTEVFPNARLCYDGLGVPTYGKCPALRIAKDQKQQFPLTCAGTCLAGQNVLSDPLSMTFFNGDGFDIVNYDPNRPISNMPLSVGDASNDARGQGSQSPFALIPDGYDFYFDTETDLNLCFPSCFTVTQRLECQNSYDYCRWTWDTEDNSMQCKEAFDVLEIENPPTLNFTANSTFTFNFTYTLDYTDRTVTDCESDAYSTRRLCVEGRLGELIADASNGTVTDADVRRDRYSCQWNRGSDSCEHWDASFSNLVTAVTPCYHRFQLTESISACVPGLDTDTYTLDGPNGTDTYALDYCFYIQDTRVKGGARCLYNAFDDEFAELNFAELDYWNGEDYQDAYERCFFPGVVCEFGTVDITQQVYQSEEFVLNFRGPAPNASDVTAFCADFNNDFDGCTLKTYDTDAGENICEYLGNECSPRCDRLNGDGESCVAIQPYAKCTYILSSGLCTRNTLEQQQLGICRNRNCATRREVCNLFQNETQCVTGGSLSIDECTWLIFTDGTPNYCERDIRIDIPTCVNDVTDEVDPVCEADDIGTIRSRTIELEGDCIFLQPTLENCVSAVDRTSGQNCVFVQIGSGNTVSVQCFKPSDPEIGTYQAAYGSTQGVTVFTIADLLNVEFITSTLYTNVTLEYLDINVLRPAYVGLDLMNIKASGIVTVPDKPEGLWTYPCTSTSRIPVGDQCCNPADVSTINYADGTSATICADTPSDPSRPPERNPYHPQHLYLRVGQQICADNPPDIQFAVPSVKEFPLFYMCKRRPDVEASSVGPDFCPQYGFNVTKAARGLYECFPFIEKKVCVEMQICDRLGGAECQIEVEVDEDTGETVDMVRLTDRTINALADTLNVRLYNNSLFNLNDIILLNATFEGKQDLFESNFTGDPFTTFLAVARRDMEIKIDTLQAFFGESPQAWRATLGEGVKTSRSNFETTDGVISLKTDRAEIAYHSEDFLPIYIFQESSFTCRARINVFTGTGANRTISEVIEANNCVTDSPFDFELPRTGQRFIHYRDELRQTIVSPPFDQIVTSGSRVNRKIGNFQTFGADRTTTNYEDYTAREPNWEPSDFEFSPSNYVNVLINDAIQFSYEWWCGRQPGVDFDAADAIDTIINAPVLLGLSGNGTNVTTPSGETPYDYWDNRLTNGTLSANELIGFYNRLNNEWLDAGCDLSFSNHIDTDYIFYDPADPSNSTYVVIDFLRRALEIWEEALVVNGDEEIAWDTVVVGIIEPIVASNTNEQCNCNPQERSDCRNPFFARVKIETNSGRYGMCRIARNYEVTWFPTIVDSQTGRMSIIGRTGIETILATFSVQFSAISTTLLLEECPVLPLNVDFADVEATASVQLTNAQNDNIVVRTVVTSNFCPSVQEITVSPGSTVTGFIQFCQGDYAINITSFGGQTTCYASGPRNFNLTQSLVNAGGDANIFRQAARAELDLLFPQLAADIFDLVNTDVNPQIQLLNITIQLIQTQLDDFEVFILDAIQNIDFNITIFQNGTTIDLTPIIIEQEVLRTDVNDIITRVTTTETITSTLDTQVTQLEQEIQDQRSNFSNAINTERNRVDSINNLLLANTQTLTDAINDANQALADLANFEFFTDLREVEDAIIRIDSENNDAPQRITNSALAGAALVVGLIALIGVGALAIAYATIKPGGGRSGAPLLQGKSAQPPRNGKGYQRVPQEDQNTDTLRDTIRKRNTPSSYDPLPPT